MQRLSQWSGISKRSINCYGCWFKLLHCTIKYRMVWTKCVLRSTKTGASSWFFSKWPYCVTSQNAERKSRRWFEWSYNIPVRLSCAWYFIVHSHTLSQFLHWCATPHPWAVLTNPSVPLYLAGSMVVSALHIKACLKKSKQCIAAAGAR